MQVEEEMDQRICDAQAVLKALNMCEKLEESATRMTALLRGLTETDGFNQLWCVRAKCPTSFAVTHAQSAVPSRSVETSRKEPDAKLSLATVPRPQRPCALGGS
jgi:hypothetical protein